MKRKKPPKLKTFEEYQTESFRKDPELAIMFLQVVLQESSDIPEVVNEAIKRVAESMGLSVEQIAKKAKRSPSTIHKALGKGGNPTLHTLTAILKALGLRITLEKAS